MNKPAYYLMNKDNQIMRFHIEKGSFTKELFFVQDEIIDNHLPIGFQDINDWITERNASNHNRHIKELMEEWGCKDNETYIQITHAASINDTFWIKAVTENTEWKNVSLYRNSFTEMISRSAFEGIGINQEFSPTVPDFVMSLSNSHSPELAVEGSFRRCFRKETHSGQFGSDIFFYKRGLNQPDCGEGIEQYGEVLASEIAAVISPNNAVRYQLSRIDGKIASRCNLFTNEEIGFAPLHRIIKPTKVYEPLFQYFYELGNEQQFREMLVIDSLCFNPDRHFGNMGVLFDNDTLEIKGISPIYDLNYALMPDFDIDDFSYGTFGNKLAQEKIRITGLDYTELGRMAINNTIRDRVAQLVDFKFSFRGDERFPEERVKLLEKVVRAQAEAIL